MSKASEQRPSSASEQPKDPQGNVDEHALSSPSTFPMSLRRPEARRPSRRIQEQRDGTPQNKSSGSKVASGLPSTEVKANATSVNVPTDNPSSPCVPFQGTSTKDVEVEELIKTTSQELRTVAPTCASTEARDNMLHKATELQKILDQGLVQVNAPLSDNDADRLVDLYRFLATRHNARARVFSMADVPNERPAKLSSPKASDTMAAPPPKPQSEAAKSKGSTSTSSPPSSLPSKTPSLSSLPSPKSKKRPVSSLDESGASAPSKEQPQSNPTKRIRLLLSSQPSKPSQ